MEAQLYKPFMIKSIVKLKDYEPWGDYRIHKNEQATIRKLVAQENIDFDCEIEWKDKNRSFACFKNMILINGDWDE